MAFDPKSFDGFKKIDADKHFTTFQHPEGHIIRVAHKGMDRDTRQELRFLKLHRGGPVPGYAGGGAVARLEEDSVKNGMKRAEDFASYTPTPHPAFPVPEVVPDSLLSDISSKLPQPTAGPQLASLGGSGNYSLAAPQAPTPGAQDPYGIGVQEDFTTKGLAQQTAGFQGQANAQGAAGKAQAAAQGQGADALSTLQSNYQKEYNGLLQQRSALEKEVAANQVNPEHFWDNRGSFGKVTAAIGVLISGLGGAHENAAMSFINKEIDRDLKAQETNLGSKQSLLEANLKQFGNQRDAFLASRAMLLDVTAAKVAQAAAKSQNPMAQAQAQQAIGKLNQESAGLMGQIAARKAILGAGQGGTKAQPEMVIRAIVPEAHQEKFFKELGEMQQLEKTSHNLMSVFNKVTDLNTPGNRTFSPLQSKSQIDALIKPVVAELSKATAGRFTETDAKFLESLFKSATDNPTTVALKKQQLEKLVAEKMNFPSLRSIGIAPVSMKSANPIANAPAKFGK